MQVPATATDKVAPPEQMQAPKIGWDIANALRSDLSDIRRMIDRQERDLDRLRQTLFGDPQMRQTGALDRLDKIEDRMGGVEKKLDELIQDGKERASEMAGARKAFMLLASVVTVFGGPPIIAGFLRLLGLPL